eukprot:SAG31_NODE_1141_length_9699_cov_4.487604_6_plen_139_part_00
MGNCLPKKKEDVGEGMSMRLSQHKHEDDDDEGDGYGDTELKMTATKEKNFSSNVNDLFGDMMADMKTILKDDNMLKLGGKKKDKWEERKIELTSMGIQWKKEGAMTKLGGKEVSEVLVSEILYVRLCEFDEHLVRFIG